MIEHLADPSSMEDGVATPQAKEDDDDDGRGSLFDGLDGEGDDSGPSGSTGTPSGPGDLGAAVEGNHAGQSDGLAHRLSVEERAEKP